MVGEIQRGGKICLKEENGRAVAEYNIDSAEWFAHRVGVKKDYWNHIIVEKDGKSLQDHRLSFSKVSTSNQDRFQEILSNLKIDSMKEIFNHLVTTNVKQLSMIKRKRAVKGFGSKLFACFV